MRNTGNVLAAVGKTPFANAKRKISANWSVKNTSFAHLVFFVHCERQKLTRVSFMNFCESLIAYFLLVENVTPFMHLL